MHGTRPSPHGLPNLRVEPQARLFSSGSSGSADCSSRAQSLLGKTIQLPLSQLRARVAKDVAGDDEALNLPGTFVDVRDAYIAEPFLEQMLPRHTERSQDLNASLGDLPYGGAALGLRDRRFRVVGLRVVGKPRGVQHGEHRCLVERLEALEAARDCGLTADPGS